MEKNLEPKSEIFLEKVEGILVEIRDFLFRYFSTLLYFLLKRPWSHASHKLLMKQRSLLKPMTFLLVNALFATLLINQAISPIAIKEKLGWSDLVPAELLLGLDKPATYISLLLLYLLATASGKLGARFLGAVGNENVGLLENIATYATGIQYGLFIIGISPLLLYAVLKGWRSAGDQALYLLSFYYIALGIAMILMPTLILFSCSNIVQPVSSKLKSVFRFSGILCIQIFTIVALFFGANVSHWFNPESLLNRQHPAINCLVDQVAWDTNRLSRILHFDIAIENNTHVPLIIPKKSLRAQIAYFSKDTFKAPMLMPMHIHSAEEQNPFFVLKDGEEAWVSFDSFVDVPDYSKNEMHELIVSSGAPKIFVAFSMESVTDGNQTKRSVPIEVFIPQIRN